VEAGHKNSVLFNALLKALREDYPHPRRIHVILDNYRLHSSRESRRAVAGHEGRIVLHFLRPYCPNDNRIEQLWEDLHAEVTRNHGRVTNEEQIQDVRWFIRKRSVQGNQAIRKVAA
jgi:transposase